MQIINEHNHFHKQIVNTHKQIVTNSYNYQKQPQLSFTTIHKLLTLSPTSHL